MAESFNLPLLRVWCRKADAWLSFRTRAGDRYFINPYGYFVELPDGRLAQITARVAFPLINCYPSVLLSDLEVQSGFGSAAYFVYALRKGDVTGPPEALKLSQLRVELESLLPAAAHLTPPELYIAVRVVESGFIADDQLEQIVASTQQGSTFGQELVQKQHMSFEVLLGACLDTRTPGHLDPPMADRRTFVREWELAGEILIAMGKITRSKLEYALRVKREGARTIGEILTAIGACTSDDIEQCLSIQNTVRQARGTEVGLIGEILVKRGLISQEALDSALEKQGFSGRPLGEVLLSLGFVSQEDMAQYNQTSGWQQSFQGEIEDNNLASWLLARRKIGDAQLQEALAIQGRGRQMLGQIFVSTGVCTMRQVDDTLKIQQDARRLRKSGVEKLGSILLSQGRVEAAVLEEALAMQQGGRRALGEILQAVGGCSQAAVRLAVEIQRLWRERMEGKEERLGEALRRRGFLSEANLKVAMFLQEESKRPMGRVLVENNFCTPEEIIATLLMRDYKRQCDLNQFIRKSMAALAEVEGATEAEGVNTERLLQAWLAKAADLF